MSLYHPVNLNCPHCAKALEFSASVSVNADRAPELREAILDGSFQRESCPHCGTGLRLDPQLNYLDVGRGQWIAAYPGAWIDRWAELEAGAQQAFDKAFGAQAGTAAREIGAELKPRLVFGWGGLREKLVAADAGLDDTGLELTKIALMRGMDDLPPGQELRLTQATGEGDDAALVLLLVPDDPDGELEEISVPRAIYDEILAEPEDWQPLREQITAGLFVDVLRLTRGTD
ncbi:MAG: CpXC domain-containing protein [Burkholderiaceae bacterium]|nr:CpXC domain-containing protein [Burkholderiaceae bacterium]